MTTEQQDLKTNEELVIDKWAYQSGSRILRLVRPGSHHHGELIRQKYDPATGTWKDQPIGRPR